MNPANIRAENHTDLKSIRTNSVYLITGQILSRAMQVVYGAALIRHYGAVEYGMFQSAIHWYVALVPLTLLGFGPTLALRIGSKQPGSASLIQKTLAVRVIVASLLCLIAVCLTLFSPLDGDKRIFLLLFAPLLIVRALLNWTREVYIAHESSQFHFRQIGVSNFIQLAVGLCVMHLSGSLVLIGLSMMLITGMELLSSACFIYKKYQPNTEQVKHVDFLDYIKQSLPIGFSQLAIRWMLLGPIAVGQWVMHPTEKFGAASFVVLNLFFVCLLFDSVSRSWLTVAGRQSDQQSYSNIQSKILNRLLLIVSGILMFSYFAGDQIMGVVFVSSEIQLLSMLSLGMGAVGPYVVGATLMQHLIVQSEWKSILKATFCGLVVTLAVACFATQQASEMLLVASSVFGATIFASLILLYTQRTLTLRMKFLSWILIALILGASLIHVAISL